MGADQDISEPTEVATQVNEPRLPAQEGPENLHKM
jgi:hypothetical protein